MEPSDSDLSSETSYSESTDESVEKSNDPPQPGGVSHPTAIHLIYMEVVNQYFTQRSVQVILEKLCN